MRTKAIILGAAVHTAIAAAMQDPEVSDIVLETDENTPDIIPGVAKLTDADVLPDRVATHPRNRFHDPAVGNMGCRLNGVEQDLAVEACVSEGWVRVGRRNGAGRLVSDGMKDYVGTKQPGEVELYWRIPLSRQVRRARARGKK